MIKDFLKEISGINLLDIGSSGALSPKFDPVARYMNLTGFDPNIAECERMNQAPHPFLSARYLPYAIAGSNDEFMLHKTKSIYCYSLLEPDYDWLNRFSFSSLFEAAGTENIRAWALDSIKEIKNISFDIIKTDTQGLELPILSAGKQFLDDAFYVETETGFTENYKQETTFAQIDAFMRENHFLLFDINTDHRVSRDNPLRQYASNEQILWCEATWLKDYVALYRSGEITARSLTREKALKCLILCALQGCYSYGYELALLFNEFGLIDSRETAALSVKENWLLVQGDNEAAPRSLFLNYCLRLLPARWRTKLKEAAAVAEDQKHIFRR